MFANFAWLYVSFSEKVLANKSTSAVSANINKNINANYCDFQF